MKSTGVEENLVRQMRMAGEALSERIANQPRLVPGLQVFFDAFFDLDTERSHAMGFTRIPSSKVRDYAEHHGFDYDQTEELLYFVRRMDNAHIERLEASRPNG